MLTAFCLRVKHPSQVQITPVGSVHGASPSPYVTTPTSEGPPTLPNAAFYTTFLIYLPFTRVHTRPPYLVLVVSRGHAHLVA